MPARLHATSAGDAASAGVSAPRRRVALAAAHAADHSSAPPAARATARREGADGRAASAGPRPLERQSLADRLAERLSAHIDSGALAPGDRMPTEAQLAAEHGVSRSVVREAVHRIKSRGLLVSRQGSGVYVAPRAAHRALEFDPAVLESIDAVVHVVEVRRVLEGEIAALAAARATRAQVAGLKRSLAALDAAVASGGDGVAEDLAFHGAIGHCTGNPQFALMLGFLEQYLREGMRITRGNEARRADFMEAVRHEHRQIVEAIASGDAAAARRAATRHMSHSQRRLEVGGVVAPRAPVRKEKTP